MPIYAYLVSWPDLVAEWKSHPDDPAFPLDAEENLQPWVAHGDLWTDSHRTALAVSQVYEKLRGHLRPAARRKLDKLFGAFFWTDETGGRYAVAFVQELGENADGEVFAAAMRPATVRKYLALWDEAALEQLREPFRVEFPAAVERVEDFDTFQRYVASWVGLLREAVEQGRGLVVSWF